MRRRVGFGGTYCQDRKNVPEATRSSETSVYNKSTRHHIPEDNIVHSHRRENLRSLVGILHTVASQQIALYVANSGMCSSAQCLLYPFLDGVWEQLLCLKFSRWVLPCLTWCRIVCHTFTYISAKYSCQIARYLLLSSWLALGPRWRVVRIVLCLRDRLAVSCTLKADGGV
jgi:hypothetical protein